MMDLAEIVGSIANAEHTQTTTWLRLLLIEDRMSRTRRKYLAGRMGHDEWLAFATTSEADWQDTHRAWEDARATARTHTREMERLMFA